MRWMEAHDRKQPVPPELEQHVLHCATCRSWVTYLRTERVAVQVISSLPIPEGRVLRPRRVPTRSHRRLLLQWAGVLAVITVLVGIAWMLGRFSGSGRPGSGQVERAATVSTPAVFDVDAIFTPPEKAWSYLRVSGVWWTQEDLRMLSVLDTEEPNPGNP